MGNLATTGVIGNDGVAPIYNPNGRWSWWSVTEIYTAGGPGSGKYVPNINDYAMDPDTATVYKVTAVDPITLAATLVETTMSPVPGSFVPPDILFGVGPGTQADTYRVYLDTSVIPYVLAVDVRLKVAGTKAKYCKIFLGSSLGSAGTVISMVYDANGNFLSNNVPLETVAMDNVTNYSIQVVAVCNTVEAIPDGEVVTAVFYDDQANVVSKRQLLVENTSFIRSLNVSQKYITSIALDCPFIPSTNGSSIEFPMNLPINALNIQCVVTYSDGSTITLPIDGTKVSLIGLNQYVSNIVGQKIPLVLSYKLAPNEVAYNAVNGNNKYITVAYDLVTTNPDNSYDVKVYGYPEWNGAVLGYVMRFFMVNLDRNIFFDVTPQTLFAANTGLFDPQKYGYVQRKAIEIDLSKVSGIFKPYIYTQLMDINLIQAPSGSATPWTMSQVSGSDIPAFGQGLIATMSSLTNYTQLDITSGIVDFNTWLQNMYDYTFPLINTFNETTAPTPTHFSLWYKGQETIYPISSWNQPLAATVPFNLYDNVYIKFINRTVSGDMILSVAGMMINQVG